MAHGGSITSPSTSPFCLAPSVKKEQLLYMKERGAVEKEDKQREKEERKEKRRARGRESKKSKERKRREEGRKREKDTV